MQDIVSLRELKSTISVFSKYSSLNVNYEKSEAAWIGPDKNNNDTSENFQCVNLSQKSIKILGIHFTYNNTLHQQNNFDRILQSLQTVLNLWKCRPLTVFGKTTIVKTLALPKILYVTSLIDILSDFTKKVKGLILDFLWSGRKPKVKYTAIVENKYNGGLEFPDIQTKVETQHIMCIKRLIEQNQDVMTPWKYIPLYYLKDIGGTLGIRNNFNTKMISKNIPTFYKTCLLDWAKAFTLEPNNITNILSQPLVNNFYIPLKLNSKFTSFLMKHQIYTVQNLLAHNGRPKELSEFLPVNSQHYKQHILSWASLVSSIPKIWIKLVSTNSKINRTTVDASGKICLNNKLITINNILSKHIYSSLVSNITDQTFRGWEYK